MKIRDCIIKALEFLGLKELIEQYKDNAPQDDEFLGMARDVIAEICSDFYPLRVTETIFSDKEGTIKLCDLTKPIIDIFGVSMDKKALPFLIKYDHIDIGISGEMQVDYSFMPTLESLDSPLPFTDRISARVIGYGIAAEYCILNAPDQAAFFDRRYKDALTQALRVKSEIRVKRRSWL